jgi:hypothetical protein
MHRFGASTMKKLLRRPRWRRRRRIGSSRRSGKTRRSRKQTATASGAISIQLKKNAGVVKSRTSGGKPATAEARQVKETAARVAGALSGRSLTPDAQDSWGKLQSSLSKIDQAYALTPRAGSS